MIDEAARYRAAINSLVKRMKAYAKHRGVTPEYVSKLLFSDRRKIGALAKGGSLAPETYDKVERDLRAMEASIGERAA